MWHQCQTNDIIQFAQLQTIYQLVASKNNRTKATHLGRKVANRNLKMAKTHLSRSLCVLSIMRPKICIHCDKSQLIAMIFDANMHLSLSVSHFFSLSNHEWFEWWPHATSSGQNASSFNQFNWFCSGDMRNDEVINSAGQVYFPSSFFCLYTQSSLFIKKVIQTIFEPVFKTGFKESVVYSFLCGFKWSHSWLCFY